SPTFFISVQLPDSTWLNFAAPYVEAASIWSNQSLMLIGAMVVAVIALSIWVLHRLTAPLRTLAQAAQRLGVDVTVPPLPERGPRDVRQAIRAFNDMQFRLRRFVDDRTRMIAAISHDLRTPITRLRLRAEFVDDPDQQQRMLADLGEMETMIRATLAFAKEEAGKGGRKRGRYPFSRASSASSRVRGRPIGRKRSERSALASSFVTKASEPQGRPLSAFRRSTLSSSLSSPSASQADQSATAERGSRHARSIVSTASARWPQWAAALDHG
ncbi:MAG TPA: histidine kinase dimerization/phospho-acceptor domain-containing protein, partial [Methylomirabilota bacterium]|nr:histidine kinase dimerization/phospho-acceptor domain-containing protein [Methylomirabilota bacterium]